MSWIKSYFRDTLGRRFEAAICSGLVLLICAVGVFYQGGLLYGIDFTGGLQILLEYKKPLSVQKMSQFRSIFSEKFPSSQVTSVTLKGEDERSGVMVTVRARELVDQLSNHLYQVGRAGSDEPFRTFENEYGGTVIDAETLANNFSMGSSEEKGIIDITRASREEIKARSQSLVNQNLSDRVVQLLRDRLVKGQAPIDLNWSNEDEIQSWLTQQHADGFVKRIVTTRENNNLTENTLNSILNEFNIASDEFFNIFRIGGDDPDRLAIRDIPSENLRDIIFQEFFQGRYTDVAEQIHEARNDRGLFRSRDDVLSLASLDNIHKPSIKDSYYLSNFVIKSREMISPSIGAGLIVDAGLAILLSLVGILIYLYFRFELTYSFGAIGAIIHDILITVGLLTVLGVEFNVPVVAAVLTVIGYSLNDTIVNFDRVRENRVLMGHKADWYDVINRSVYEVLNRTFVTSITTFIAAVVLYLYGGIALNGFSITLLIGIISGTFSSIFVSNVILFELQKRIT